MDEVSWRKIFKVRISQAMNYEIFIVGNTECLIFCLLTLHLTHDAYLRPAQCCQIFPSAESRPGCGTFGTFGKLGTLGILAGTFNLP
jgi:hypothetical protein